MKKVLNIFLALVMLAMPLALSGCGSSEYAESGQVIISAKDLSGYIGSANTVIVDMQSEEAYAVAHVEGAVNIPSSKILTSLPVDNTLVSKGKIETVLSEAGIGNDTTVIIYDEGKSMNASRLWWTMLVYGHENAKVISGGLPLIIEEGYELTSDTTVIAPKQFTAVDRRAEFVADMSDVRKQVDDPNPNVILLENRSNEEYATEGKIPGSILYSHTKNFYKDGSFLDVQATRINYLELGIKPENEIIMYCKTSMRSATSFVLLWNAGYRNLKMYDGAFLEWSTTGNNPIEMPSGAAVPSSPRDNS